MSGRDRALQDKLASGRYRPSVPGPRVLRSGASFVTSAPAASSLRRSDPARGYTYSDIDRKAVDTLRVLAADAVEKAGHGHPGTAISLAPVAWQLFQNVMHHDPADAT